MKQWGWIKLNVCLCDKICILYKHFFFIWQYLSKQHVIWNFCTEAYKTRLYSSVKWLIGSLAKLEVADGSPQSLVLNRWASISMFFIRGEAFQIAPGPCLPEAETFPDICQEMVDDAAIVWWREAPFDWCGQRAERLRYCTYFIFKLSKVCIILKWPTIQEGTSVLIIISSSAGIIRLAALASTTPSCLYKGSVG